MKIDTKVHSQTGACWNGRKIDMPSYEVCATFFDDFGGWLGLRRSIPSTIGEAHRLLAKELKCIDPTRKVSAVVTCTRSYSNGAEYITNYRYTTDLMTGKPEFICWGVYRPADTGPDTPAPEIAFIDVINREDEISDLLRKMGDECTNARV